MTALDLRDKLLGTYPAELIEDLKLDNIWGIGLDGNGANWLGKLLIEIREVLSARV